MNIRKDYIISANRIVIKVGTSTLVSKNGFLNLNSIEKLVSQISDLSNQGKKVVLVTSGAVGIGSKKLGLHEKPAYMPKKQAAAAIGQGLLVQVYEKFFSQHNKVIAQILLTKDDIINKFRCNNTRKMFDELLNSKVIPIVNENDVTSVSKARFGDNDTLAALVAKVIQADLLIILSDIDGLYNSNPRKDKCAKLISYVDNITNEVEKFGDDEGTRFGTGGMLTKIKAAKITASSGVSMVIANGSDENVIEDIISNREIGTLFLPIK